VRAEESNVLGGILDGIHFRGMWLLSWFGLVW
jgi:hypothetical protein